MGTFKKYTNGFLKVVVVVIFELSKKKNISKIFMCDQKL